MISELATPGERIAEEEISECTDDTDSVESYPDIVSTGDIGRTAHGIITSDSGMSSPGMPPSPVHIRSHGQSKKTKDRELFDIKGDRVVYLPGYINGLTKKLHLLAAEFFEGNTTVRNELVHVSDALLRLKQLTRKEYAGITAHLAASLCLYTRVDLLQCEDTGMEDLKL